jgi:hypothetical protein
MKYAVFYHVFPGDNWEDMYLEQLGALLASKLYEQLDHLYIGFNGNLDLLSVPDKAIASENQNKQEETDTLRALHQWCKENEDAAVLYMHTKGVSRRTQYTDDWRHLMEFFCIHQWNRCVTALILGETEEEPPADLVGVNWQEHTSMGWKPHFSGGFWWAKSDYVAKLSDDYLNHHNRYWREFWIGTGEPVVCNFWESYLNCPDKAMHYTQPYPKKLYSNTYLNEQKMKKQTNWYEPDPELSNLLVSLNVNGFEVPGGTDKNTIHNYTGIYAQLLAPYRNKRGTLLEIGVQHGGSSLLWHEYLPRFRLFLSDIQDIIPDVIWDQLDPDRYDFYQGDAYNGGSLKLFCDECAEGFDVIIDDGPHTLASQVFAVSHYFPMLKPNGVLIIEDIQDIQHVDALTSALPEELQNYVQIFDNRSSRGRYDDIIWAIVNSAL